MLSILPTHLAFLSKGWYGTDMAQIQFISLTVLILGWDYLSLKMPISLNWQQRKLRELEFSDG